MILYNSENNIRDVRLFVVRCLNCFVTAVLQSIFILQQRFISLTAAKLLWDLTAKYYWSPAPNFLAGSAPGMMWPQQTTSLSSQNAINTVAHAITHKRSRDLEAWYIGSYIKRTETN